MCLPSTKQVFVLLTALEDLATPMDEKKLVQKMKALDLGKIVSAKKYVRRPRNLGGVINNQVFYGNISRNGGIHLTEKGREELTCVKKIVQADAI